MKFRAAGFTLLELLVALTVLGLVMAGVVQGIRFGIKEWEGEARRIGATAELDGIDRITRDLFHGIDLAAPFDGERNRLSFTGYLPSAVPARTRLADMTLAVTSGHRLMLMWRPHRHATNLVQPTTVETELIGGIDGIEFSYWPSDPSASNWQSSLSGSVPALIRIHIIPEKGDSRHWPDLDIAPIVNGEGGQ